MKKLALDLDVLQVDSFATETAARGHGGTVYGRNHTRGQHCAVTAEQTCLEPCGTTLCGGEVQNHTRGQHCMVTAEQTCLEPCGTTLCGPEVTETC